MKVTRAHEELLRLAENGTLVRSHRHAAIKTMIAAGLLREVTAAFADRSIFVEVRVCRLTAAGRAELARKTRVDRQRRATVVGTTGGLAEIRAAAAR